MSTRCLSIGPRGLRWLRSPSFASRRWNSAVTSSVSLPTSNTTSSILLPTRSPVLTPAEVKALIPSMQDLVLWKWDQVTVAMSGGVDSAVVLRILSEMPLDLNVIFMRNWDSLLSESSDNSPTAHSLAYSSDPLSPKTPNMSPCGWQKDWESVQSVCAHVGIPEDKVKLVDLSKEYWTRVFEPAINVWENGGTPNPDVACNREIKFGALLDYIPKTSRSFLATGHYARVKRVPHATRLCRADDPTKDQSYYLSSITEAQLRRAIMPLAQVKKEDVRKLAKYYGLPNANKEESMGLCFVGERGKFGDFISQYVSKPATQGYLVDKDGKQLAPHKGLWHYTVGQGARLSGQLEPMFVAKKCVGESGQDILVVPGSDNPALQCTRIHTHDFHWIAGKTPKGIVPGGRKRALVQIRHRMEPIPAVISHDWNGLGLTIDFLEPVHGVAAGQVCAVFYLKWCLGSGVIKQTWNADTHPVKDWKEIKQEEGYFGAEEAERLDIEVDEGEEGEGEAVMLPSNTVEVVEEEGEEIPVSASTSMSTPAAISAESSESSQRTTARSHPTFDRTPRPEPESASADDFWSSASEPAPTRTSRLDRPSSRTPKILPALLSPSPFARDTAAPPRVPSPERSTSPVLPDIPGQPLHTHPYQPDVARIPRMKGYGAPRGYDPSTPFGDVSLPRHLRPEAGNQFEYRPRGAERREGYAQASSDRSLQGTEQGRSGSRGVMSGMGGMGGASDGGRSRETPLRGTNQKKGFGISGSRVQLDNRPLAFEARAAIGQERGARDHRAMAESRGYAQGHGRDPPRGRGRAAGPGGFGVRRESRRPWGERQSGMDDTDARGFLGDGAERPRRGGGASGSFGREGGGTRGGFGFGGRGGGGGGYARGNGGAGAGGGGGGFGLKK